ncbi:MAG: DUF4388 domain-containing protein [Phormidesmis sp.]
MLLQGQTSEYSLPELFKFLKDSRQTGRLSLKSLFGKDFEEAPHYLWFEEGNLVATSRRLDGLGLLNFLQERYLIQSSVLPRLLRQCPPKVALGAFLKTKAMLTVRQLQSLFSSQVLSSTCTLMQAPDVRFAFYPNYPFPYLEMTGIKIQATDITLPSLRMIKSWGALIDKLPELNSGLKTAAGNVPRYRLNSQEKTVLALAESGRSLSEISAEMILPKLDVQKIGFRLIFVGLAKEVPMIYLARTSHSAKQPTPVKVSKAFLSKLSNYLQQTDRPASQLARPAKPNVYPATKQPQSKPVQSAVRERKALALQGAH